jgi:hypothetical protein
MSMPFQHIIKPHLPFMGEKEQFLLFNSLRTMTYVQPIKIDGRFDNLSV